MRRLAGLAVLPLLAACIPPEGVTDADLSAFDSAVASVGCDIGTERQYIAVGFQTGMPREKLVEIAQYKVSARTALPLSNGGARLVTGACTPESETEPDPEPAA